MSKFQEEYTIACQSFEDLILVIFVLVDDLYQKIAPYEVRCRRNVNKALMSDSEIITIAVCGEMSGKDSENEWYAYVKKNFRHLFPKMCDRSQFNRTRRNLLQVTEMIFVELAKKFEDDVQIVDSFPLEVCKFGRAYFCKSFRTDGATYGYCATKKHPYFGYKGHIITTCAGAIKGVEITPANIDDRRGLEDLCDTIKPNTVILGDKGYVSEQLESALKERQLFLMALKRKNAKRNYNPQTRGLILKTRRRVETTLSQLTKQFNIERVLAKSFRGLLLRLLTKILAFNLSFSICRSAEIKSLVI